MRGYEFELDHNSCGCTLDIDIYKTLLNSGLTYDSFHLPGDVV